MADERQEQYLVAEVEMKAKNLCEAVHRATNAGVSEALLLPALISVFREAGMIPQDLDLAGLFSMFR